MRTILAGLGQWLRTPSSLRGTDEKWRDLIWTRNTLAGVAFIGVVAFSLFAATIGTTKTMDVRIASLGVLLGGAALLCGAFAGFLFGVPKTLQPDSSPSGAQQQQPTQLVNTNLEQISDWLTKIIIGIGLVELRKVPDYLENLGKFLVEHAPANSGLTSTPMLALVTYFSVLGFLGGYLLTRLFLAGAFRRAEGIEELVPDARRDLRAADDERPIGEKVEADDLPRPSQSAAVERLIETVESQKLGAEDVDLRTAETVGKAYYHREEYNRAIPFLQRLVQDRPRDADAALKLALVLGESSQREEAVKRLEALLRSPAAPTVTSKLLGYFLLWFPKRLEESLAHSADYLKKVPDDSGAIFNLACAHAQLHRLQRAAGKDAEAVASRQAALNELKRASELDPRWKERARDVEDFDSLRGDAEFLKLVGG